MNTSRYYSHLPRESIADHLDVDLEAHAVPELTNEVLINPRFQFAHPMQLWQWLVAHAG